MGEDYTLIGKVELGNNVIIEKGVVIYGPVIIGNNVYIGRNSTIGYPILSNLSEMLEKEGKLKEGGLETKIGDNVKIYPDSTIYEGVEIGDNVKVFHRVLIREKIKIGENSMIGTNVVLDGPDIEIGKDTLIHASVYICSKTKIGNNVFVGPQAGTINEKKAQSRIGLKSAENYRELEKGPLIKDYSCIGEGAHIMMGVIIGEKSVLGAGSLAVKDIPEKEIWKGNPAKFLRKRDF